MPMNCHRIQEKMSDYWDLPADDPTRRMIDYHVHQCTECSAEFTIWRESCELIRLAAEMELHSINEVELNHQVMERIYKEEAWLRPVLHQSGLSHRVRTRRMTAAMSIVASLAVLLCSIVYFAASGSTGTSYESVTGFVPAASAGNEDDAVQSANFYLDVPVASISDPIVLKVNQSFPYRLIAIPVIAFMSALLLTSWLSVTRAAVTNETEVLRARRKSRVRSGVHE